MKCPHCQVTFTATWRKSALGVDSEGLWAVLYTQCDDDDCGRLIVRLLHEDAESGAVGEPQPVLPKAAARPVPREVDDAYAQDFAEAATVLPDSAKASAALSRRLLQSLLRDQGNVKPSSL